MKKHLLPPQGVLFIEHQVDGEIITQRPRDGYINVTALCKKAGKELSNYLQNKSTSDFLEELCKSLGIPRLCFARQDDA